MTGSASAGSASRIIGDTCISKLSHDEPPKIICRLYADRQFGSLQPEHKVFRHAHARPGPLIEELANFFVKSLHASKATRMSPETCVAVNCHFCMSSTPSCVIFFLRGRLSRRRM